MWNQLPFKSFVKCVTIPTVEPIYPAEMANASTTAVEESEKEYVTLETGDLKWKRRIFISSLYPYDAIFKKPLLR